MGLQVYNTLTRTKEPFETIEPNKVRLYVCGPTVYNNAHVGHAMSSLVFDIIRRYLEYRGYTVKHVMNYTDVDDKIIQRANAQRVDPYDLAQKYIDQYDAHLSDLSILPATLNPRATTEMDNILSMISGLIEKGYAYPVEGDVYFRVEKLKGYGKLSGRKLKDMQAGARIGVDERKENPMDFALWKAAKEGEPAWESPWGMGRPGWHIECSAMSVNHLGEQIDIHGGGNDLIFPHHENEIAQTEALTGKQFSRFWMHNGMLQLSGEKMSKSVGNLITIDEFLSKHPADALRMMVLNSGYRNPLTFNDEVIGQAEKALDRLASALKAAQPDATGLSEDDKQALADQMEKTKAGFTLSMDDDFNSAGALGYLFELVRAINQARANSALDKELSGAQDLLRSLTSVLGLTIDKMNGGGQADAFIDLLVEVRAEVRSAKLWELSDMIRDRLADLGVIVEDAKGGSTWTWK